MYYSVLSDLATSLGKFSLHMQLQVCHRAEGMVAITERHIILQCCVLKTFSDVLSLG